MQISRLILPHVSLCACYAQSRCLVLAFSYGFLVVLPGSSRPTPSAMLCPVLRQRTPRNKIQETAISVKFVPGMRFLVFDFGVYDGTSESGAPSSSSTTCSPPPRSDPMMSKPTQSQFSFGPDTSRAKSNPRNRNPGIVCAGIVASCV
eukprot:2315662-Rhodomonas_salina.1